MSKLVNFQLIEAKNVICVWREDQDPDSSFRYGIALETALGGYALPRYILVGTFDDEDVKVGGILDLNDINIGQDYFLYDQFLHEVDLDIVKSFVRKLISEGSCVCEEDAKNKVLADMQRAGVDITDDAMEFLRSKE